MLCRPNDVSASGELNVRLPAFQASPLRDDLSGLPPPTRLESDDDSDREAAVEPGKADVDGVVVSKNSLSVFDIPGVVTMELLLSILGCAVWNVALSGAG